MPPTAVSYPLEKQTTGPREELGSIPQDNSSLAGVAPALSHLGQRTRVNMYICILYSVYIWYVYLYIYMITSIYTCIYICIYQYIYNVYIYILCIYRNNKNLQYCPYRNLWYVAWIPCVYIYIYISYTYAAQMHAILYNIIYIILYIVMLYVIDNIFANHTSSSKSFAFLLKKQKHLLSGVSATGLWLNPAILLNKWQITSLGSNCQTSATADQSF